MAIMDVNCLLGHWPFRKLYRNTLQDLRKVHADNGISNGFVSSLNSIFYNDPFEGEEELHEIIKGTEYKHILTVNPALPGFLDDIERGLKNFDIKGVRIYPGYHNYRLNDPCLAELCSMLRESKLPLFLTARMEDERINYIFSPSAMPLKDVSDFLSQIPNNKVLLINFRQAELMNLKDTINSSDNVFFETSGLKDQLFIVEKLLENFNVNKIIYGSLHPLFCLKSTLLLVEKAEIPPEAKDKILGSNIEQLFE